MVEPSLRGRAWRWRRVSIHRVRAWGERVALVIRVRRVRRRLQSRRLVGSVH